MSAPRSTPFLWVTWLSKVMAGEQACYWSSWFKAHYQDYTKLAGSGDLALWNIQHTKLLAEERAAYHSRSTSIRIESQNAFKYSHRAGVTISGRPDLIVMDGTELTIIDCKTGKRRMSDQVQVMIYIHLIPFCFPELAQYRIAGRLVYNDGTIDIAANQINDRFIAAFDYFVELLAAPARPSSAPSANECRFCDISQIDCPSRWLNTP
jgi:predicted RecB family nuclease